MRLTRLVALTTLALPLLAGATPTLQGGLMCCNTYVPADSERGQDALQTAISEVVDLLSSITHNVALGLQKALDQIGVDCTTPHIDATTFSGKNCAAPQQLATCEIDTGAAIGIGCVPLDAND
ncbi:hypothetical protein BDW22DRAFT_1349617 [Trametopsis cervina]|nr:hypothetical protein BDW22DRAFT_1349617 [Trametopsis cervina]